MRRASLLGALLLMALSGCAAGSGEYLSQILCRNDSDCSEGQVCFADGCGSPDMDVRVEVTPNVSMGRYAQDFVVEQLFATQDFTLLGPASIGGEVLRQSVTRPGELMPAQLDFTVRAQGESALIPGLVRRFEATVSSSGTWSFAAGTGNFSVTVIPKELPPLQFEGVSVAPGTHVPLNVIIPAQEQLVRIDGRLVQEESKLLAAAYDIQAFDPDSLQPLSARTQVSQSVGDFQLHLAPQAEMPRQLLLRAMPRDPKALLPTKDFFVDPDEQLQPLQMGDPGPAFTVTGQLLSSDLNPLPGAIVHLSGTAGGGGVFETARATTDVNGNFTLDTLAPGGDFPSNLILHANPPAKSPSGILEQELPVTGPGSLGVITCPDRAPVTGLLRRPDGSDAVGVTVIATPIAAVDGLPVPSEGVETRTDSTARYNLQLDPAVWRLDFLPGEQLPRMSRIISVGYQGSPPTTQEIEPFILSRGRMVSGVVKEPDILSIGQNMAAAQAAVRVFRVVEIDGKPTPLLLSQTVTDENGKYSLVMPTR